MSDPPPDERGSRRHSDNPTAEEINRVAVAFETYTREQKTAEARNAKHNRKMRRWARAATVGALIYTLVTAGVLIVSIRSIQEARRATHYASRAAAAASRQADISEKTAKSQLRAYVTPQGGIVLNFGTAKPFGVAVSLKNSGQTPAYKFSANGIVSLNDYPLGVLQVVKSEAAGPLTLGPRTAFWLRWLSDRPLNDGEMTAISSGRKALYTDGTFQYIDIFGNFHHGRFRLFYGGKTGTPPGGEMSFYNKGNE